MADLEYLSQCRETYRNELVNNIMPFWLKYGLDRVNGGVYTCIDRDGTLMDTTKSVWFQGRFGYVAASAYNSIEKNPEWLAASKSCIDFIENHCIDTDGHMFFTVTAEGKGVQKRRYVFSECFAIIAMAEYSKATGDKHYANRALELFKNMMHMLNTPGFLPAKTSIEAIGHSITMMLINVALILQQVVEDPMLDKQIDESIDLISNKLVHPEFETILEMVGPNGEFIDTCAGRTINPGHCIETGWFILALARARKWDARLVKLGTQIIDWAWKWGWDEPYGGMINFRDCRNFPPQDYSQDMKFWWPQCETIIAGLYAYLATGEERYLEMHRKAHEYAFKVFADKEFGEWYGYLHRDGTVAQPAKGNIFKGPFHVPRMMIVSTGLCSDILNK
jgi:N-acylglucosamine 2-epimerase